MPWIIDLDRVKAGDPAVKSKSDPRLTPCAAIAQTLHPGVPRVAHWTKGAKVKGNGHLRAGTVIAIFNSNGDYAGSSYHAVGHKVDGHWVTYGIAHTALYV